jgi:L-arabinonolactonase
MRADLLVDCRNTHGEGVVWSVDHECLAWTDIHGQALWTHRPSDSQSLRHATPGRVCCFAFRRGQPASKILAAFDDGIAFLDLGKPEAPNRVRPEGLGCGQRLNDGRTDRRGRLIVGGMAEEISAAASAVWRVDPDLSTAQLFDAVTCANGLCFSPDGATMYFADSPTRRIEAFAYDADKGIPSARRTVAAVAGEGVPDGSCIDAEGFVWNAVWEGYRVERWSPDGRLDRTVEVPVRKPTCCTFGGADLDMLFITSSRLGESEADLAREPAAGGLFAVKPGVRGIPDIPFAA